MKEERTKSHDEELVGGGMSGVNAKVETPKKESWLKRVINFFKWLFG